MDYPLYFFVWSFDLENTSHKIYTAAYNLEQAQLIFILKVLSVLKIELEPEVRRLSDEEIEKLGLTATEPGVVIANTKN